MPSDPGELVRSGRDGGTGPVEVTGQVAVTRLVQRGAVVHAAEAVLRELRKFVAPEFVFGWGARRLAGQYARNLGATRALVVTDPGVVAAGWTADVVASLDDAGLESAVFDQVTPNPRDHEVMAGAEAFREASCDVIVAVGGGSPMDCAKGIGIVHSNGRHVVEFEGVDNVPAPMVPLVCVPTTSGTAADVSQFAIVTDTTRHVKIAIVSKAVVPDVSLTDPECTLSMDRHLTACTGLDALTHAVEAHVSNAHSPMTDLHALEAARLVGRHLAAAVSEPGNEDARAGMALASLHAGLAFSNASLGAVHAMAHALGGLLDTAHGESNAILLGVVAEYNAQAAPERYSALAQALGASPAATPAPGVRFAETLHALRQATGITRGLADLGATRDDVPGLARAAMADACMVTNPRRPTLRDIEALYERAL